ncbi:hypothetical protein JW935_21280 [candidate division KSB1 bacterium]|nr:hypothetical protein [candidate division KSB1 bacterium]
MIPRQRLLTSLQHSEPDRVPIDLAGTPFTGISAEAYKNLRHYLDMPAKPPQYNDVVQQTVTPHEDMLLKFGVDTRGLWPRTRRHHGFPDRDDGECLVHVDEWGLGYQIKKQGGLQYEQYSFPLQWQILTPGLLAHFPWPDGGASWRFNNLREQAITYRQQGYTVVLKSICAGLLEMAIRLRGMEECLVGLLMEKKVTGNLFDQILRVKLDYWDRALDLLGDVVDVIAESDHFSDNMSQLISIATFRDLIEPRQRELVRFMRRKAPDARIFFHCCGNIRDFLPDFINMGIQIINPVNITIAGMEPELLKKDFGNDIVFWGGGIDTQGILVHGTPQQVRDEVTRNLEILATGGGYVFNTIHNIPADAPPKNIAAMYETVLILGY